MDNNNLVIAIASGKGGTGKTTVATNLAVTLARRGVGVTYLDCDVEEPDGHIFLKPEISSRQDVTVPIPKIDLNKCTFCGDCSRLCRYNALAVLSDKVVVFPELCHSCRGCVHICPEDAITEVQRPIGQIVHGTGYDVEFLEGRLNIGEAQAPPITRQLKKSLNGQGIKIIDAPPGTSCPVVEAVGGSDFTILVTEPTPFGLNDLILAAEMLRKMALPFGVVVNRAGIGDNRVDEYCRKESIDILLTIPDRREIAEAYSRGQLACEVSPELEEGLNRLYDTVKGRVIS